MFGGSSPFREKEKEYSAWTAANQSPERLRKYREKYRFPRTTPYSLGTPYRNKVIEAVYDDEAILNLGSGRQPRPDARWINLDVRPHHNVDIVADAHYLSFADNSLGAAVADNSFEYFDDPYKVAQELWRVIRPGGMVYAHVPFLLPIGYGDRFRYTADGLRAVFRDWQVVDAAPTGGPFRAMARVAERAAEAALPGRIGGFLGAWVTAWLMHPLKYLDPWVLRRDSTGYFASSFCIVAQKQNA